MPSPRAFRIILTLERGEFRIISTTRVEKLVPPSDDLEDAEPVAGAWIAVEGADGRAHYRRFVHDPFAGHEIFTGEEKSLRREQLPDVPVTLSLLIPDAPGAESVLLYATAPDGKRTAGRASPVFRIRVAELEQWADREAAGDGR